MPRGAVEARVSEGEDAPVGGDEPVAGAARGGCDADDRLVENDVPRGAVEARVSEGEDAPVGGDQPVAVSTRCDGCVDDGLVQPEGPQVARPPDVAVRGDEPGCGRGDDAAARRIGCAADSAGLPGRERRARPERGHAASACDQPAPGSAAGEADLAVRRCATRAARRCDHADERSGHDDRAEPPAPPGHSAPVRGALRIGEHHLWWSARTELA